MNLNNFLPFRKTKSKTPGRCCFQILSDLHLEVGQQYEQFHIPPKGPNLVLAGDIGRLVDYDSYLKFLARQVSCFERVFLVLGNHEFYGLSFDAGIARARQLEKEPALGGKLVFLHQSRWDDGASGVTVLGCTLWSNIPEQAAGITAAKINDFKEIEQWTLEGQLRDTSLQQIAAYSDTAANPPRRVLVITHHAPCVEGTSRPEDSGNPWSAAFATDVLSDRKWGDAGIGCWVFGHTHYTTDMVKDGVRVVSNQRGYVFPSQQQQEEKSKRKGKPAGPQEFDVSRVIEL